MIGIAEYFSTANNTQGGFTKFLVVKPPTEENHMSITQLDEIFDSHVDDLSGSEICITFREKFRDNFTDYQIKKLLAKTLNINPVHYILYPEYGDSMRLHYHGIVWGRKVSLSELKKQCKHIFGITTLSMIRKPENYKEYVRKERKGLTNEELCKLTIFKLKN